MKLFKKLGEIIGIKSGPSKEELEIRERLERVFGPEKVDDLFAASLKLSQKSDLTPSEAADKIIQAAVGFEQIQETVKRTWEHITKVFREAAEMFMLLVQDQEQQERMKRIQALSYRKKKSQSKNWSKWKKRR